MSRPVSRLTCYASTTPGLEALTAAELSAHGLAVGTVEPGGVEFSGTGGQLVESLLWLRTANRITVRIAGFHARTFAELEREAATIDWPRWAATGLGVHFRITSKKSKLYHEDAIAERLERSVQASMRGAEFVRAASAAESLEEDVLALPRVQRFVVRIFRDDVTISADASGGLLHRRGYRLAVGKAPLRETLAAAMLRAIDWQGTEALCDPFCGSGTLPIEAALRAANIAPGALRRFAAEHWGFIAPSTWAQARAFATSRRRDVAVEIEGSDRDEGVIRSATENAARAGVAHIVQFTRRTISELPAAGGAGWLVTNPPYGARVGDGHDLRDLYSAFGRVWRERRPLWSIALLNADRKLASQIGMPLTPRFCTTNGGIPVELLTDQSTTEPHSDG